MIKHKTNKPHSLCMSFDDFLDALRQQARSEREKGELFELAIRDFLREDLERKFANVWLWRDWVRRSEAAEFGFTAEDSGIDLVAEKRDTGARWAIQCKFYADKQKIKRDDINSFLATARGIMFSERLIVTTVKGWSDNALDILNRCGNECRTIDYHELANAPYSWYPKGKCKLRPEKKQPHPHQRQAVAKAKEYFDEHDRGKLIMACGSGKTYTSLRILEAITTKQANVLFLAPSIALVAQTLKEYAYESELEQRFMVVCSDSKADKDSDGYTVASLPIPPTTDAQKIAEILKTKSMQRTIVFCTYQSLVRIKEAQEHGCPKFDLVICDEAHRTTGVEGTSKGGNYFTLINNQNYVQASKRLYMTATPRIYTDNAKSKARDASVEIHSMDDEKVYGKDFYRLNFSAAIKKKLLADYKVIILTVDESYAAEHYQAGLKGSDLNISDAAKLVGCFLLLFAEDVPSSAPPPYHLKTYAGLSQQQTFSCSQSERRK